MIFEKKEEKNEKMGNKGKKGKRAVTRQALGQKSKKSTTKDKMSRTMFNSTSGNRRSSSQITLPKLTKTGKKKTKRSAMANTTYGKSTNRLRGHSTSKLMNDSKDDFYNPETNNSELRGPEKFNFFSNLKQDRNKIIQFMDQSKILENTREDRVSKILDKSRFWEERLKSYLISAPMKQRMIMAKNTKSLVALKTQLADHTEKEMKILNRKNRDLVAELNKVSDRIRIQKREIQRLKSTLDNDDDENAFKFEKGQLISKGKILMERAKRLKTFRDRMTRINAICEINQIQNEEWIRSLNFYQRNLEKAIEDQERIIEKKEVQEKKLDEQISVLVEVYNSRRAEHHSLIRNIEDELERKKYIDENIMATDVLIKESVKFKKKKF
jgi:hypothetical protein